MIMKAKSMAVAVAVLTVLGAGSALAGGNNLVEGQEVTGKAQPEFTSTRTRAEVQDEAIKAAQDGTLTVNISKVPTVEGQLVGAAAAITSADVGSSSKTRAQVQEEFITSRAKHSGMPDEVFLYM
jgi:Domain of unknown function (DUF4148)